MVAGNVAAGGATKLVLRFGRGGQESFRREVVVDPATAPAGRAGWIWAVERIRELTREGPPNLPAIVKLATARGVLTPWTSFLVLERFSDYLDHGVAPPPELGDAYGPAVAALVARARDAERQVARRNAERVEQLRTLATGRAARSAESSTEAGRRAAAEQELVKGRVLVEKGRYQEGIERLERVADRVRCCCPLAERDRIRAEVIERVAAAKVLEAAAMARRRALIQEAGRQAAARERVGQRRLFLGFYDVSDIVAKAPDLPAPELGLSMPRRPEPSGVDEGAATESELPPHEPVVFTALDAFGADATYDAYLRAVRWNGSSPLLFVNAAQSLLARGRRDLALRVLSNLGALWPDRPRVLRELASGLAHAGETQRALATLERIAAREGSDRAPRDLELACADAGNFEGAVEILEETALEGYDDDVVLLALGDLASVVARARRAGSGARPRFVSEELLASFEADLRAVLVWDEGGDAEIRPHFAEAARCDHAHVRGTWFEELVVPRAAGAIALRVIADGRRDGRARMEGAVLVMTVSKNHGRANEERTVASTRVLDFTETLGRVEARFTGGAGER